jgi:hypothetical protein
LGLSAGFWRLVNVTVAARLWALVVDRPVSLAPASVVDRYPALKCSRLSRMCGTNKVENTL